MRNGGDIGEDNIKGKSGKIKAREDAPKDELNNALINEAKEMGVGVGGEDGVNHGRGEGTELVVDEFNIDKDKVGQSYCPTQRRGWCHL